jgi:heat shock protein HslJ
MRHETIGRRPTGAVLLVALSAMQSHAAAVPQLDGTAWVLERLGNATVPEVPAITLGFAGGRVSGSDGCNRYTGTYRITADALVLGPELASTKMACAPDVMATAAAWTDALAAARSWRIVDGRLELLGPGGTRLATLAAQSVELAGTHWKATGINNGREAVVSIVQDTAVTLSFDANGSAAGSSGCNRYTAQYRTEGASIEFGKAAATMMACAQADVMQQEQNFFRALETAQVVRVEGDRLELRTATGALAASFVRTTGE